MMFRALHLAALCGLVAACSAAPNANDVWNSYDIRHPAPYETGYNGYPIDNDAYYAAPDCTVMDSPACGE